MEVVCNIKFPAGLKESLLEQIDKFSEQNDAVPIKYFGTASLQTFDFRRLLPGWFKIDGKERSGI